MLGLVGIRAECTGACLGHPKGAHMTVKKRKTEVCSSFRIKGWIGKGAWGLGRELSIKIKDKCFYLSLNVILG